jgi:hypothetical protein
MSASSEFTNFSPLAATAGRRRECENCLTYFPGILYKQPWFSKELIFCLPALEQK